MTLSHDARKKLEYSGYRFVGDYKHSAVKICHWTRQSLLDKGVCYKEKFYGIESHRCLQMSPAVPFCQQKCEFCWRDFSNSQSKWSGEYDEPGIIIDEAIEAQNKLLCGFFGNDNANKDKLLESKTPTNAAISLAGEPTLYPEISQLIQEFKKRNFTTFLVSNGQFVEKLKNLETEPYQLYLSLDAPDKKTYDELCNPQIKDGWNNLNESLETLSSFQSRTCIRVTTVKGKNMINPKEYGKLIEKADPNFVEIKAYMCVGSSRDRLTLDNMPTFDEVVDFATKIGEECGREIVNDSEISRVVLLE
ncbi:4-demethylwyosine synthase TYW1 [Methanobrevibacter sp. OttesenSCG-928-I08]|nr:4-demethylwyosine synthase TYW1 [Methanobrevibacter sp. OttesenSCG-928-I08]